MSSSDTESKGKGDFLDAQFKKLLKEAFAYLDQRTTRLGSVVDLKIKSALFHKAMTLAASYSLQDKARFSKQIENSSLADFLKVLYPAKNIKTEKDKPLNNQNQSFLIENLTVLFILLEMNACHKQLEAVRKEVENNKEGTEKISALEQKTTKLQTKLQTELQGGGDEKNQDSSFVYRLDEKEQIVIKFDKKDYFIETISDAENLLTAVNSTQAKEFEKFKWQETKARLEGEKYSWAKKLTYNEEITDKLKVVGLTVKAVGEQKIEALCQSNRYKNRVLGSGTRSDKETSAQLWKSMGITLKKKYTTLQQSYIALHKIQAVAKKQRGTYASNEGLAEEKKKEKEAKTHKVGVEQKISEKWTSLNAHIMGLKSLKREVLVLCGAHGIIKKDIAAETVQSPDFSHSLGELKQLEKEMKKLNAKKKPSNSKVSALAGRLAMIQILLKPTFPEEVTELANRYKAHNKAVIKAQSRNNLDYGPGGYQTISVLIPDVLILKCAIQLRKAPFRPLLPENTSDLKKAHNSCTTLVDLLRKKEGKSAVVPVPPGNNVNNIANFVRTVVAAYTAVYDENTARASRTKFNQAIANATTDNLKKDVVANVISGLGKGNTRENSLRTMLVAQVLFGDCSDLEQRKEISKNYKEHAQTAIRILYQMPAPGNSQTVSMKDLNGAAADLKGEVAKSLVKRAQYNYMLKTGGWWVSLFHRKGRAIVKKKLNGEALSVSQNRHSLIGKLGKSTNSFASTLYQEKDLAPAASAA